MAKGYTKNSQRTNLQLTTKSKGHKTKYMPKEHPTKTS